LHTGGAACGAIARYQLGVIVLKHNKLNFPLGTFLINTVGSTLLGVICGLGFTGTPYLLLGDGFCGAFTTFSTFTVESIQLIQGRARKKALLFIAISVIAGITGFLLGYFLFK
jgi:CrcB protein